MTEKPTSGHLTNVIGTNIPRQLADVRGELLAALNQAIQLTGPLSDQEWTARPDPARWSIAECLMHLNLSSEAFLPLIREAIERGRREGIRADRPYRRDFAGWLLCRLLEPPARMRVKTPAPFEPKAVRPKSEVMATFERLQKELVGCVERAAGFDLGRLRIASPFARRLRYNLYSAFRVIPAHQRRHLWQAEQVKSAIRADHKGAS